MDFFEAQARAKTRSRRLVALFVLAVLGTIAAMYAAAWFGLREARAYRSSEYDRGVFRTDEPFPLWQPGLLAGVTAATLAVVGFGSLFKWAQFSAGGRAVAESLRGRKVDPGTNDLKERRLLNVVEEMALASGVPVPAVYVLDQEPAINAFAAGLTTNDAVVAVTRGTIDKLSRDELQGVIAHEFSHILNGDMRLNLRIAALIFGILVLGLLGRGVLWSMRHTRVSSRGNNKNGGGVVAVVLVVGLALLIVGYVGYFFGRLIQAAVSRQREFLADASAVQFTRNPSGVAGALKKIGGYALGSNMQSNQSAALGHFFFAQAFRSSFTGWWATHPPLPERIRAIEPGFDGRFYEPPEIVDIERESFVSAGLAPARKSDLPPKLSPQASVAAVAAIGTLTSAQISGAQELRESIPVALRDAAHARTEAPVVVLGILLDRDPTLRGRQRAIVLEKCGAESVRMLDALEVDFADLADGQRLPLLQLTLPALRELSGQPLARFLDALDEIVHADARVTPFEYALQRVLTQALAQGANPRAQVVQYHSFHPVAGEIAIVLSVLANASTERPEMAVQAFAAGAAQLKLVEQTLTYLEGPARSLEQFDAALDKLARASLPIRQRTLIAAAQVVNADGQLRVVEFELLRAVAAALDIPMPPHTSERAV